MPTPETCLEELHRALRSVARSWRETAIPIALLTLGIASATAVLSVGDALVRRPLPVERDAELVVPFGTQGDDKRLDASAVDLAAWRAAPSFASFAGALPGATTIEIEGRPQRVRSATVEPGYFRVLGVGVEAGRLFDESDVRSSARTALVGRALAERWLGGAERALGAKLRLDGESWEIVGVVPAAFDLPAGAELWTPLDVEALDAATAGAAIYQPVARLAAGRTLDDARAELSVIAARVAEQFPEVYQGWTASAIPLRRHLLGDPNGNVDRSAELTLLGAILLLLIASANVAQLELVRAAARRRDLGIRLALGATRGTLAREAVFAIAVEVALATLLAAPLALALATALVRLGPAATSAFSSRLLTTSIEPAVLLGFAALAALTGLVAGLGPVLRVARRRDAVELPLGSRTTAARGERRWLDGAVVGQVALAVALLAGTLTLVESYGRLARLDVGFQPADAAYFELSLSPTDYGDPARRAAFVASLAESVAALPGVEHAGVSTNVPLQAANWIARYRCPEHDSDPDSNERTYTNDRFVAGGYAEALGLRLVAGRLLDARDRAGSEPTVVVNEALARQCWPGVDPIGRTIVRVSRATGDRVYRIVGVVADAREMRVSFHTPHPTWYQPYDQMRPLRPFYLVVRGKVPTAEIRDLVARLDPHLPLVGPVPLARELDEVRGTERMAAVVMSYFALFGLLLVGIGLFGSLARHVATQRRALGVRLAFGAEPRALARLVVRRSLRLTTAGAVVGLVAGAAFVRVAERFASGSLLDPRLRLIVAAAAALVLALGAAMAPARRASRIQPAHLLRE